MKIGPMLRARRACAFPAVFFRLLAGAIGSTVALTGCGGGGSGSGAEENAFGSGGTGALRFFVPWPDRSETASGVGGASRVIPEAADRIKVLVEKLEGGKLAERLLLRPSSVGQTGRLDITNVPAGNVRVTVTAYPNPEGAGQGAGIAQASGSVVLVVRPRQRTTETLTLTSTVSYVQLIRLAGGGVGENSTTLFVGEQQVFAALARDAAGNLVVTGPREWFWNFTISPTQAARFVSDGQMATVTGVAPGELFFRALFIGVEPGLQEPPYSDVTLIIRPAPAGSGSLEIPVQ